MPQNLRYFEPFCQLKGFDIELSRRYSFEHYNVTVSWEPIPTIFQPSIYVLRHGRPNRRFIYDPTKAGKSMYELEKPEPLMVLQSDKMQPNSRISFKLPKTLGSTDIRVFQICSFWQIEDLNDFYWPNAPTYVVDLAARADRESNEVCYFHYLLSTGLIFIS